jgi:23S rRNA A2030 N6-methylase RlmJ
MHACGMFIFNAPWQLDEKLQAVMPQILEILAKSPEAKFDLNVLKDS